MEEKAGVAGSLVGSLASSDGNLGSDYPSCTLSLMQLRHPETNQVTGYGFQLMQMRTVTAVPAAFQGRLRLKSWGMYAGMMEGVMVLEYVGELVLNGETVELEVPEEYKHLHGRKLHEIKVGGMSSGTIPKMFLMALVDSGISVQLDGRGEFGSA